MSGMSKNNYVGLYNRGTVKRPRWWYRLRWPGEDQPRRGFLSTDREVALLKFAKIKGEKADRDKYGSLKWSLFKEQYFRENAKAPKSTELERRALVKFELVIKPQFLTDLTPQNLLTARNAWTRDAKVSPITIDTWKKKLLTIARWAEDMNLQGMQNWRIVKSLAKVTHRRETHTEAEYEAVMTLLTGKWLTAAMLASEAGLRRSEVFYLKWVDLNLAERIGQIVGRDGWNPKMEGDDRRQWFVLTPRLVNYLIELKRTSKSGYVFADPDGFRPASPGEITRYFGRLGKKLDKVLGKQGSKTFFHKFRHTYVTRLLERGADLAGARNAARHRNASTTERYDHTSIKKALRTVDFSIFPERGEHKSEHSQKPD